MIFPDLTSPVRPVIAAFYRATYRIRPGSGRAEWVRVLREVLAEEGLSVGRTAAPYLDLVVEGQVGVAVLPSAEDLTQETRRRIREGLAADGGPEVVLLMAFVPQPRLGRVDAPLHRVRERRGEG
ncbi:MAG TPA: hypothetical protein ENK08_11985 [Chloroflexi bacterium]|nr:hypothetical protein [Chloroflexota bacterium]